MKTAVVLAIGLVLVWVYLSGGSPDEDILPSDPGAGVSDLSAGEVRRNSVGGRPAADGEIHSPGRRAGLLIKIIDRASGQTQEDCALAIEELGLELSAHDLGQAVLLPESRHRHLLDLFHKSSAETSLSVHVQGSKKELHVSQVNVRQADGGEGPGADIVVDRYARLLVGVAGAIRESSPWTCRVSLCPPVPPGLAAGERRGFELRKRRAQSYRRAFGGKIEGDYSKSVDSKTTQGRIEFLIHRSGEFFVEGLFPNGCRGTGEVVRLELGETKSLTLQAVPVPIVSGILLDVDGTPLPNQRIRIRGKGPLTGGRLFVPKKREGKGMSWDPGMSEIQFQVTTSTLTDADGQFEVPLTLTGSLSFEVYVQGRGKLARTVRVADTAADLRGIVLQLQKPGARKNIVKLIAPKGEDLTQEQITLTRIDGDVGSCVPIAGVDADGWLDTRWLTRNGRYAGRFDSRKYADFFFSNTPGEQVQLELRRK